MNEIKKIIDSDKILIGKETTLKSLKKGELLKIYLANNIDVETFEDINYYAKLSNTEVIKVKLNNDELGTFCKKPFSIAVIGLKK